MELDAMASESGKKWKYAFLLMTAITLLAVSYMYVMSAPNMHAVEEVRLETKEDFFVDVDGDGDLDYVHYVQFIRQENEEVEAADPYPAPQPGQ